MLHVGVRSSKLHSLRDSVRLKETKATAEEMNRQECSFGGTLSEKLFLNDFSLCASALVVHFLFCNIVDLYCNGAHWPPNQDQALFDTEQAQK